MANKIVEVTNGHYREIEYRYVIDGDILEWDDERINDDTEMEPCFKYKKEWYSLNDFILCQNNNHDACMGFSYFSGLYIDLSNDNDSVKVTYFYQ